MHHFLSRTPKHYCFVHLATLSTSRFRDAVEKATREEKGNTEGHSRSCAGKDLWIDDVALEREKLKVHHSSAAYRELHRPAMTTSGMGLFGGEPGFEKAYRVWVDPDRPHMKHIYNQTALAKNLRYSRYGYFKRDMHLLDVDKLIRHARLLPTPNRLLNDFLYQRVMLTDQSCAALLRYQRQQLEQLESWAQGASLQCAEEMFERMIVTNLPPVDVGPLAHAEMILCCAVCLQWEKGWEMYYHRAKEVEEAGLNDEDYNDAKGLELNKVTLALLARQQKSAQSSSIFVLDTVFFEAVMQLCLSCSRPEEGFDIIREVIDRHLRLSPVQLEKGMILASMAVELLDEWIYFQGPTSEKEKLEKRIADMLPRWINNRPLEKVNRFEVKETREKFAKSGLDLWALFDFYKLPRSSTSMEAYFRLGAALNQPLLVLNALRFADMSSPIFSEKARNNKPESEGTTRMTLPCFYYLVYGLRSVGTFGDFILETFSRLSIRGLQPDYILFTITFQHCARHSDGELALAIYEQHWLSSGCHPTPELVLAYTQACATCSHPSLTMLQGAEQLMNRLEEVGSPHFHPGELYDALLALAGELGAVGFAFSKLKVLVSYGVSELLTTRCANSLLLANANAEPPNGCVRITEEIMHLFHWMKIDGNNDTIAFLEACLEAFGTTDELSLWLNSLRTIQAERGVDGLGHDANIASGPWPPPHQLRQLRVRWNLSPRDTVLSRFGQHTKPAKKFQVGSMLGSTVPFGRSPGEQRA